MLSKKEKEKETRVTFNPGFSANRPLNNWAQNYIYWFKGQTTTE